MKKYVFLGAITISAIVLLFFASNRILGNATDVQENFRMDGSCLVKYEGNKEEVVIPKNVTAIGEEAFSGNTVIKKLQFPDGLKEICYDAFSGCTGIESITIPDSVEKIATSAFTNCTGLKNVSIGSGLKELGSGVFAGCNSLEQMEVSEKNKDFTCLGQVLYSSDRKVLYQYLAGRKQSFYIMNSNVNKIEQYAFWGADKLEYVTISNNIKQIDDYAFSNCNGLKSVTLTYAVTKIGMKAFEDCVNLEQIYVPNSVSSIHVTAFDGCKKVKFLTEDGFYASKYAKEQGIEILDKAIFQTDIAETLNKEDITEKSNEILTLTATPEEETDIQGDLLGKTSVVGNQAVVFFGSDSGEVILGEVNSVSNRILKQTAENGTLKDQAFYQDETLQDIVIPSYVKAIGKLTFARASIKSVVIPESVTTIGTGAFYHCDNLEEVAIPKTVTKIGENAFEKTPWLQHWYEQETEDYLIVGDGILLAYRCSEEDFVLPDEVKSVACKIPAHAD